MAKELIIEKSIVINKPLKEVFNYLKYTQHQNDFSVWNLKDPHRKKETKGINRWNGWFYLFLG